MKRCPTCGSTYTNDKLLFCLEDGASLVNASGSVEGFDPQATLRVSLKENILPPTEPAERRAAPTVARPAPAETAPPRTRRDTNADPSAAASAKTSNRVLVIGISAIVLLLLVIAGIGVALLVNRSSADGPDTKATENSSADRKGNRQATVDTNSPDANSNGSRPASNQNGSNKRDDAARDAMSRAEAKVLRDTPLSASDLAELTGEELRRLRNTIYARHGRTFDAPDLQRYFDSRPWYTAKYDYSEAKLSATDRANIKLIQATETARM